ncbi:MAG TPA: hypothetical protein VEX11_04315 [Acetobacteraceae bacterium]|nr:hypothetical protein [Acetobacteraceae bacterium]
MSHAATSTAPFGFGPLTQDAPPAEVALVSRLLDLARAADSSGRIHQAVLLVGAAMRRWARLALASKVTGPAETPPPRRGGPVPVSVAGGGAASLPLVVTPPSARTRLVSAAATFRPIEVPGELVRQVRARHGRRVPGLLRLHLGSQPGPAGGSPRLPYPLTTLPSCKPTYPAASTGKGRAPPLLM